jgi:toxin ParE1/3/4
MIYQVIFSKLAFRQLKSIERHFVRRGSPQNAVAFVERIVQRCERIGLAPYQGSNEDQFRQGVRTTGFEKSATIAFRVVGETVRILSVSYGGKEWQSNTPGD